MLTVKGHRDDEVAKEAAHAIAKYPQEPACVVAGIHAGDITEREITEVLESADHLIRELIAYFTKTGDEPLQRRVP